MKILKGDSGWSDFCIYWSDKYLGFHLPLHSGWQNAPHFMPGGWEYYEAAILYGNKTTEKSRWFRLPKIIVPAKLVHLWRMRRKSYRDAFKYDRPISSTNPDKGDSNE